jgi:electron transport complex protein RnfD
MINPIAAPHAHDRFSVDWMMRQVCYALLPATVFGFYLFGWPAIQLWVITCLSALITEAICLIARGQKSQVIVQLGDGSALLTGWLLAMSLPPWAPWWIGVLGSAFAIAIGKHLYGGIGHNLFNPAMLARTALLISFPVQMTTWANVLPINSADAPGFIESLGIIFNSQAPADGSTGATSLGHLKTALSQGLSAPEILSRDLAPPATALWGTALWGAARGSMAETSALLLGLGGIWLLALRIIRWYIPVSMLLCVAVLASLFEMIDPQRYAPPLFHLLSGGLVLGAFFIATDLVTSPSGRLGQIIFGAGCGALAFIIRTWGGYPEAVAFAVLMMNALTPLIDLYCRPRIYGHRRKISRRVATGPSAEIDSKTGAVANSELSQNKTGKPLVKAENP